MLSLGQDNKVYVSCGNMIVQGETAEEGRQPRGRLRHVLDEGMGQGAQLPIQSRPAI